ncbi:MAG TPA: hypothetical protein VII92_04395 [Anaerolineae bacterium]
MARQTKQQIADTAAAAQAVKDQQAAELKRMRAVKRAAKISAAAHVDAVQPEPEHADIGSMFDGVELPSAKRVLVGFILGIATAASVGYGIGMLLAYALAGIMLLTSTAWIAFVLSVLAWIIAIYAGWKVGGYVGGKVFASVVMPDGLAARSVASVSDAASNMKAKIGGWFTTKEVEAAPFTGAYPA